MISPKSAARSWVRENMGQLSEWCATIFDFGLFALVLLCCISLVAVAALMGHHWSARVRSVTDSLVQLATGQLTSAPAGSVTSSSSA